MDKLIILVISVVWSVLWSFIATVPVYFIWNDLAPTYLAELPKVWQQLPFLDTWAMLILVRCITQVNSSISTS